MKPDTTFIAARIIGPLLIVSGVMLITQTHRMMAALSSFMLNEASLMLGGFVAIIGGLTLLILHNRYDTITGVIVSLIGWAATAKGVVILLIPTLVTRAAEFVSDTPNVMPIAGCVIALMGVWLAYTGYIAGTLRVETSPR